MLREMRLRYNDSFSNQFEAIKCLICFKQIDCTFPFQYNGVWYDTCTLAGRNFYWCSIDAVYSNRWSSCSTQCPQLALSLVQTDNHTSCQSISPNAIALSPNSSEISTILSLHNTARSIVSPTAANMALVGWDIRLARIAQSRSNQCIFAHDCASCRKILNNRTTNNGQNAFSQSGGSFSWTSPVNAWLNEKQYFVYGSASGSSTGNWAG